MRAPPLAINDLEPPDCFSYALNAVNLTIPPSLRKAHHFFEFTCLSIRISSACSTLIFCIASFSRSSSLSLLTIETCMPAYLDFQR